MKIAILQLNTIVGDIEGNAAKIISSLHNLKKKEFDLAVTSELSLLGYPPKDLLLSDSFIERAKKRLEWLAQEFSDYPPVLVGTALPSSSPIGKPVVNVAALLQNGKIDKIFAKALLPAYDVFDEFRYFEPASGLNIFELNGKRFGVTICEDIWKGEETHQRALYALDPIKNLMEEGIDYLINISGSPFAVGKQIIREQLLGKIAKAYHVPVIYVNQVGGNDDLVFDGRSCVFDRDGVLRVRAKEFTEDMHVIDVDSPETKIEDNDFSEEPEVWNALILGTRDYVRKCGFQKAIIGLSGGIDSAVCLAVAVEAIGKENVYAVHSPSPYTKKDSTDDARLVAKNIGVRLIEMPIEVLMQQFGKTLKDIAGSEKEDITAQNIQPRIRATLLMALANKHDALLLCCGNKSEIATGYFTLYGDSAGGLAPLADVYKTTVYKLAAWINKNKHNVFSDSLFTKIPSAELYPGQTDQDMLPPYDMLDKILYAFIEKQLPKDEIISYGLDKSVVEDVIKQVMNAEFKRKQLPVGIKVSTHAFGSGWRMPIAAHNDD